MAKKRGLWAEIQRERALRAERDEQQRRAAVQAGVRAQREAEKRRRAQEREAAANEAERKRLLVEERKAEAAGMTADVETRIAELEAVLATGIAERVGISFDQMKQSLEMPHFDPAGLDEVAPAPEWADFAPKVPGALGRAFGGARKHEQATAEAMRHYDQALTAHGAADTKPRHPIRQRRSSPAYTCTETAPLPSGVSIWTTLPASSRVVRLSGRRWARDSPPAGRSRFAPTAPGPSSHGPHGCEACRSVMCDTVQLSSAWRSRSMPLPPGERRALLLSSQGRWRRTRIGKARSRGLDDRLFVGHLR